MLVLSTILPVKGYSVHYNIYKREEDGLFFFKPTQNDTPGFFPPCFFACRSITGWVFENMNEQELIDQAIEEMDLCYDGAVK
jgi:hypothetical protein